MYPEHVDWTVTEYLLAEVVDQLAAANWQRGNAGAKQPGPKPQPMYRPQHNTKKRRSIEDRVRDWKRRHATEGGD